VEDRLPPPMEDLDFETGPRLRRGAGRVRPQRATDGSGAARGAALGRALDHAESGPRRHRRRPRHLPDGREAADQRRHPALLEALNFEAEEGAEPGVEAVDTAIQKAVLFEDDDQAPPSPKAADVDRNEIERADVASAKATQWTDRAKKPAAPKSREPIPDLETAVKSGNVDDMMASFLADLLEDDDID
jgi:hypothetical protein